VKQHLRNTICSNYQKKRQQGASIGISVPFKPDKAGKKSGVYCGQTAETNESQFTYFHDKWLNLIMLTSCAVEILIYLRLSCLS